MDTLTPILTKYAAETRFADIPRPAIEAAKHSLLDAIGVMMGASTLGEGCKAFADQARETGGKPQATVLGFGFKTSAVQAALCNGAQAHALDYEDAFDDAASHPNAQLVPAALAIAEAKGGVSGQDLLAAIAVGCDLTCRLGLGYKTSPDVYGFYPPPMIGAFGAAAAAGRLLGLNQAQMEDAFALTLCQSVISAQFKQTPDSMIRAVRDGFAAQAGIQAAQLAARGVRGFTGVFEGKYGFYSLYSRGDFDPAKLTHDLGKHFYGADVSFKPWPACRGTHGFIESALKLCAENSVKPEQIAHMTMTADPVVIDLLAVPLEQKLAPKTAIDAKFSLAFTVSAAIIHKKITLQSFTPAALADPQVLALARRSIFVRSNDGAKGADAMTWGKLELQLSDGRWLSNTIAHPLGHPTNPLKPSDLRAKFLDCASYSAKKTPPAKLEALVGRVAALESDKDVSNLLAGL